MKKIFLLTLMLFVCFFAFGCADVNYFLKFDSNGEVSYGLDIKIDEQKIVMGSLNDDKGQVNATLDELEVELSRLLASETEKMIALLETGELIFNKHYTIINSQKSENGILNFKYVVQFSNVLNYQKAQAIFSKFGEISGSTKPENMPKKLVYYEKSFLTIKKITLQPSVFCQELMSTNKIVDIFKEAFNKFNIKTNLNLSQTFATTDRSLKSNANKVVRRGDVKYHTWFLDSETATQNNIKTYYVSPNAAGWYVLTIGITFVFVVAYLIYIVYKTPLKTKFKTPGKKDKLNK